MSKVPRASGSSSVPRARTACLVHFKAALGAFEDLPDNASFRWQHNDFQHTCWSGCEEDGYHTCSFIGCGHQTKQRINMKTHGLHHFDIRFPCGFAMQGCTFQSADPAAHSKHLHMSHRCPPLSRSSKSSSSRKRSRRLRSREMRTSLDEESLAVQSSTSSSVSPSSWLSRSPSPLDFDTMEFYQRHYDTISSSLSLSSHLIDPLAGENALSHSSLVGTPSLDCLSTVSSVETGDHVSPDQVEWLTSELTSVQHTPSHLETFYDVYGLSLD